MQIVHYLDGKFVTEENLVISPRDLGFTRGYAVFDFFRTYNGHKPFMFDYHIDRFFNSARAINLPLPWTKTEIKGIITKTLRKNDQEKEFAVRIMASGGTLTSSSLPTLIVILDEAISFPESIYTNGIEALTLTYRRDNPNSKTTHYLEAIKHMKRMESAGAGEILYVHDDLILEGAYSNFFCVINDVLITPKHNILPGATRFTVIEKLDQKIPIKIRDLRLDELYSAAEAFVSVSGKGIVPVIKVDGKVIGHGKVGPITKDIHGKFNEFIANGDY